MITSSMARSVADLTNGTIHATVEIAAPAERVFCALASEEITKWWGQDGLYRTTEWTGDVKKGGRWRSTGVGADGSKFSVEGEYLEVDAPKLLVHTWKPDWADATTTVTYRLDPIDGGTRLTLRHEGFTGSESCRDHADGWIRVFGWLHDFCAPRPSRSYFHVRLMPPRASFMQDITENERRVMGEHAGYWRKLLAEGIAVVFGPVADPKGGWGVGIVAASDKDALASIQANDPAIEANIGLHYEVLPMLRATH